MPKHGGKRIVPGVADGGHYNHMPQPATRISLSAFMEKLLCSPTSASGHETRQTYLDTLKSPVALCRCHIWWFANFALAAEVIPRSAGVTEADLRIENWDFKFYYLGCKHKWHTGGKKLHQFKHTCPLCGAVERWDSS